MDDGRKMTIDDLAWLWRVDVENLKSVYVTLETEDFVSIESDQVIVNLDDCQKLTVKLP